MALKRKIFQEEHEMFRKSVKAFVEREIVPHHAQWEEAGIVPHEVWKKAGELGFLCTWLGEEYGGPGADFISSAVVAEEVAYVGASGVAFTLHSDIVAPYIASFGTEEQKKKYLPKAASGDLILALAMTEPNTGSDVAAIKTTAVDQGDHYLLNGSKTFISNGHLADLVIVAAKTNPQADPPHAGVSLLLVESGFEGFERGRRLKKIGMKAQDTAELHFTDCRVPKANLLGDEGMGFYYMMQKLAQERLVVAITSMAGARAVLEMTVDYAREREAFGRPISRFQNTRFTLAEVATEVEMGQVFVDRLIEEVSENGPEMLAVEASMAKWWCSEMLKKNADRCLQFFGGYGYMEEYPISKAYLDARVQTIYAGTTEIMKEIISRGMGL
ncbi:MAG: acyl-CoA dehydrogenase family protein [Myxococcales bacterium]|nr:acyl-CoA dehydrogenase family protein [Myxococcales bacterium]